MHLTSNRDLRDYLKALGRKLKANGDGELSTTVDSASAFFFGMSTEFMIESREALRKVSHAKRSLLSEEEWGDFSEVLKQVEKVLAADGR